MSFFIVLGKKIIRFICNHKKIWIARIILKTKNKPGGVTVPGFKLYHKAIVIKTVWFWHLKKKKNILIDQWSRIKNPEKNSHISGQLILEKSAKNTQWGKLISSINNVGKIGYSHAELWSWTPILHHSQKWTQNGLKI